MIGAAVGFCLGIMKAGVGGGIASTSIAMHSYQRYGQVIHDLHGFTCKSRDFPHMLVYQRVYIHDSLFIFRV